MPKKRNPDTSFSYETERNARVINAAKANNTSRKELEFYLRTGRRPKPGELTRR